MKRSWAQTIRVPWYSTAIVVLAASLATVVACGQQAPVDPLERLAASYRGAPNVKDRAALLHFAAAHSRTAEGALARLALARGETSQGRSQDALAHLHQAAPQLLLIADYVGYLKGLAYAAGRDFQKAAEAQTTLLRNHPRSPLRDDAALSAAWAWIELQRPDDAIRTLKSPGLIGRQPEFDFLLGKAYLLRNDLALAAEHLQRVYTDYPARKEASDAGILLKQIEQSLGAGYPPLTARTLLRRAEALLASRQYEAAEDAFQSATAQLMGEDKERAQVQVAAVRYASQRTASAQALLQTMAPRSAEADAQRLYLLTQCARRLNQTDALLRYASILRERYPHSEWTMDAHRWAGNYFLLDNKVDQFMPLFQACADAQRTNPESAYCHWKVSWRTYLERKPEAHQLLSAHLERYPHSDKYVAALFFLGRLAERDRRLAAASAYYQQVTVVEPLSYYAELAATSLRGRLLDGIAADAELAAILTGFRVKPLREGFRDLKPLPEIQRHVERAMLLARVSFHDWAEMELRSYQSDAQQRHLLAISLANLYAKRGDHFRALRTMKSMTPGYFRLQTEQAPEEFWQLLFPMPYGESLASYSKARNLDPHLVAGLIRQESEYKPDAVSRAKAYGLMQVLPSTGRSLARKLGLKPFSVRMLTRPDINLNMGTHYLSDLRDSFDGRLEYVLASYNAGSSRANRWKTWADFAEPIEFIETIPFTETREYVLSVYRNAMVYRAIYPELLRSSPRLTPASDVAPVPAKAQSVTSKPTAAKRPAARRPASKKPVTRKPASQASKPATRKIASP